MILAGGWRLGICTPSPRALAVYLQKTPLDRRTCTNCPSVERGEWVQAGKQAHSQDRRAQATRSRVGTPPYKGLWHRGPFALATCRGTCLCPKTGHWVRAGPLGRISSAYEAPRVAPLRWSSKDWTRRVEAARPLKRGGRRCRAAPCLSVVLWTPKCLSA